jgi:hypothetical protein
MRLLKFRLVIALSFWQEKNEKLQLQLQSPNRIDRAEQAEGPQQLDFRRCKACPPRSPTSLIATVTSTPCESVKSKVV